MGDLIKGLFNLGSTEHIEWPFSPAENQDSLGEFTEGLDPVMFLQLSQSGAKNKKYVRKHKKKKKHIVNINSAPPRAEFLLPGLKISLNSNPFPQFKMHHRTKSTIFLSQYPNTRHVYYYCQKHPVQNPTAPSDNIT